MVHKKDKKRGKGSCICRSTHPFTESPEQQGVEKCVETTSTMGLFSTKNKQEVIHGSTCKVSQESITGMTSQRLCQAPLSSGLLCANCNLAKGRPTCDSSCSQPPSQAKAAGMNLCRSLMPQGEAKPRSSVLTSTLMPKIQSCFPFSNLPTTGCNVLNQLYGCASIRCPCVPSIMQRSSKMSSKIPNVKLKAFELHHDIPPRCFCPISTTCTNPPVFATAKSAQCQNQKVVSAQCQNQKVVSARCPPTTGAECLCCNCCRKEPCALKRLESPASSSSSSCSQVSKTSSSQGQVARKAFPLRCRSPCVGNPIIWIGLCKCHMAEKQ